MSLTKVFKKELDIWKKLLSFCKLWTFGLIGEWKYFESGTHEMFKIRVDLRFQILVPVLMCCERNNTKLVKIEQTPKKMLNPPRSTEVNKQKK
ncbi:unnamed protein product [Rhizophagus irregularis]|uniref:Uncharacterized protein n=1 Tax=Rhizophagus irregularis TaxID=588596 RepID=A0A915YZP1_9GLOM|nr:unnamed protein product [Rhizophagus irregularis]